MRFLRIGPAGAERPVAVDRTGAAYGLRPLTEDITAEFLAAEPAPRTAAAIAAGRLPRIELAGERIGAPLARAASIICIGMNYAAHAAESGAAPPPEPVVFFKKPNTMVGPNDPIELPPGSLHLDWEVELAVVIGRPARGLDPAADPLELVAGYALTNDLSERELQLDRSGGQWSKGKCAPGFAPLGPWIATPDEFADVQRIALRSWVNDEPRQDSTTADMVFPVAEILRDLLACMPLEPGDVILTGTPEGVALSGRFPYLRAGDRVRMSADGLGEIEQLVVAR
ncbi:fumarylacetoacetate hydrolase family protein [Agromyces soli]|uniref:Fumarylacetoacetate hydrolase family protein n=1 Tax=Agromyces soli TaxID=659012 RepID=A0ABY4AVH2_9MICO|nr:fumarylacetoacetate hydrolase family protein [Agromyces soli]UOE27176.1 fumarylacetoacetate hydrolase family protein [Agromyces soli]